jgi:hypothetical protein
MGDCSWNQMWWIRDKYASVLQESTCKAITVFNPSHTLLLKKSAASHHGYQVSSARTSPFKVWIKCRIQRQGLISHKNPREVSIDVYVRVLGQTNGSEVIEYGCCKR